MGDVEDITIAKRALSQSRSQYAGSETSIGYALQSIAASNLIIAEYFASSKRNK